MDATFCICVCDSTINHQRYQVLINQLNKNMLVKAHHLEVSYMGVPQIRQFLRGISIMNTIQRLRIPYLWKPPFIQGLKKVDIFDKKGSQSVFPNLRGFFSRIFHRQRPRLGMTWLAGTRASSARWKVRKQWEKTTGRRWKIRIWPWFLCKKSGFDLQKTENH